MLLLRILLATRPHICHAAREGGREGRPTTRAPVPHPLGPRCLHPAAAMAERGREGKGKERSGSKHRPLPCLSPAPRCLVWLGLASLAPLITFLPSSSTSTSYSSVHPGAFRFRVSEALSSPDPLSLVHEKSLAYPSCIPPHLHSLPPLCFAPHPFALACGGCESRLFAARGGLCRSRVAFVHRCWGKEREGQGRAREPSLGLWEW